VNKTKIEWCDLTWSPVTGCLYDCPYCYAQGIARRFGTLKRCVTHVPNSIAEIIRENGNPIISINEQITLEPYPYDFLPTFHRYRLDEPVKTKKPKNIFVCSMADLFGEWVPDEWIKAVFEACEKAPQHRYLFLTKNPERYYHCLPHGSLPENFWLGTTITDDKTAYFGKSYSAKTFLSIEPIISDVGLFSIGNQLVDWVIIGAETGNRKGKVTPERKWIENIVDCCREKNVPIFMKNSLRDIWKEPLIQEYPW